MMVLITSSPRAESSKLYIKQIILVAVNCGEPPVLENGQWKTQTDSTNLTNSGVVVAHCNIGYKVDPSGNNKTTCQLNGTWTQAPTCRSK